VRNTTGTDAASANDQLVGDGHGAEAVGDDAHHAVSRGDTGHLRADLGHDARALGAQGVVRKVDDAEGDGDVAEVQARRVDGDPHLVGTQWRPRPWI
jgi:hypothetical protein